MRFTLVTLVITFYVVRTSAVQASSQRSWKAESPVGNGVDGNNTTLTALLSESRQAVRLQPLLLIFQDGGKAKWFRQFHASLMQAAHALGVAVKTTGNIEKAYSLAENDVLLLLGKMSGVGSGAGAHTRVRNIVQKTKCTSIFYETEPYDSPAVRTNLMLGDGKKWAPFHEVWTYSYEVIKWISSNKAHETGVDPQTRVVFLPPGYSPVIDYRKSPARGATVPGSAVTTLMDDWQNRLGDLLTNLPPNALMNVRNAWNDDAYAHLVASHHVAIDVHKKIHSGTFMDSNLFRMGPMLASGMRVVSEHCIQEDEDALAGLVDFVERAEMPAKILTYLEEAKNETTRLSVSEAISSAFAERFNMTKMLGAELKRLGFFGERAADEIRNGSDQHVIASAPGPTSQTNTILRSIVGGLQPTSLSSEPVYSPRPAEVPTTVVAGGATAVTSAPAAPASQSTRCEVSKVALCMTGETRTFPEVASNLWFTHIGAVGASCVDTFIVADVSTDWKGDKHARSEAEIKKYIAEVHRALDLFKPVALDLNPRNATSERLSGHDVGNHCSNKTEVLSRPYRKLGRHQFEKNYRCWKLVQAHEKQRGRPYDWALRIRTDTPYPMSLPPFDTWPPAPPARDGGGLVCSSALYRRPSKGPKEDGTSTLWPVFDDQWGLIARAAADAYFLGPHLMQIRCWEESVYFHCGIHKKHVGWIFRESASGMGNPNAETRQSLPLVARNLSLCILPFVAAGGSAIQRSENDDPKYYGLINSPEWYENETNRLPDFGDFHKYSTLWRNSYKIHKHHGGRPQVVLRRDGLWHPDNSSAELMRKKIMPEGSHWPNASMERACEEAMVAASRDVEEEALEEPHRTTPLA